MVAGPESLVVLGVGVVLQELLDQVLSFLQIEMIHKKDQ